MLILEKGRIVESGTLAERLPQMEQLRWINQGRDNNVPRIWLD